MGSPTFGQWTSVRLDDRDRRAVYLSEGLGHGFCSLEDGSTVVYLCSEGYNPAGEHEVHPLDPAIGIDWPLDGSTPELSAKDAAAPTLARRRLLGSCLTSGSAWPTAWDPANDHRGRARRGLRALTVNPAVRRDLRLKVKSLLQPGIDTMGNTAASYVEPVAGE